MDYAETIMDRDGKFYVISKMQRSINLGPYDRPEAVTIATLLREAYTAGQEARAAMMRTVLMIGDD